LVNRRAALRALLTAPIAAAGAATSVDARDYATAAEVWSTIAALSQEVEARLGAVARAIPAARTFADSAKADLSRHRRERVRLRGVAEPAVPEIALDDAAALPRLRRSLEQLMHAHAEGLPALPPGPVVHRVAEHMSDVSRLLTIVDLWIGVEGEGE
jgi:hypothetical protein